MTRESVDYLMVGPGTNTNYFSGLQTSPDERLQLLIIQAVGKPVAVLPEMYLEKAKDVIGDQCLIRAWSDNDNPFQLVAEQLNDGAKLRIAVDDTLRADHLLGLQKVFPGSVFDPASLLTNSLRACKDEHEIGLMAKAGELADMLMTKLQQEIRSGITEKELALFIEIEYKSMTDDISFKPIVASGPNGALPHHSPGNRKLQEGDLIVIDCGALHSGYCSDITRTFSLGRATAEMKNVYAVVREANERAFETLKKDHLPSGEEVDFVARTVITEAGYGSRFTHRLGHGIGLDVHEAPYLVEGSREPLRKGMTFTIEPGIYLPGEFGVRIEDVVAITGEGPQKLTAFTRDLLEI